MSRFARLVRKAGNRYTDKNTGIISTVAANAIDPNDRATYTAGTVERHLEPALVTYTAAAQTRQRAFLQEQNIDIVLDFFPEADLSGDTVKFLVNGEEFAQKDLGGDVSEFFTTAGPENIFRTVLAQFTGRREGRIRFVSARETVDLYHYDLAQQSWSWVNTAALAGRATVDLAPTSSDLMEISIEGVSALRVDANEQLDVESFAATGRMDVTTLPRLEFYVGQTPVASLTKAGRLSARRLNETAADPNRRDDLTFSNGGWLWSVGESGIRMKAFEAV